MKLNPPQNRKQAFLIPKIWMRIKVNPHLMFPLLAAIVCGVIGCGNPEGPRRGDSRAQILVAWNNLRPIFVRRHEHLSPVISAYDRNYGFSAGAYTGNPRGFGWAAFDGQGIDIYSKFPEMRVSDSLKAHLKKMATGAFEDQMKAANAAEQDLLEFIAAASLIPQAVEVQELQRVQADVANTQADLMSAAANCNALINIYNSNLYRRIKWWFSKHPDLSPIDVQLIIAVGGAPANSYVVGTASVSNGIVVNAGATDAGVRHDNALQLGAGDSAAENPQGIALDRDCEALVAEVEDAAERKDWKYAKASLDKLSWLSPDNPALHRLLDGELGYILKRAGRVLRVLTPHTNSLISFKFSPDGRHFLSWGAENIKLWELATGKEVRIFGSPYITSVAMSPDGNYVLASHHSSEYPTAIPLTGPIEPDVASELTLWEVKSGKEVRTVVRGKGYDPDVAFSGDGKFAFSLTIREVKQWDTRDWNLLLKLPFATSLGVEDLVLSPDGRYLLCGTSRSDELYRKKEDCRLIEMTTGRELWRVANETAKESQFGLNGEIVVNCDESKLLFRDISNGRVTNTVSFTGEFPNSYMTCAAIAPGGRYLCVNAGARQGAILVLDVSANRFGRFDCDMSCAAFAPDGRYLCVGTRQGSILVLDALMNRVVRTLNGSEFYRSPAGTSYAKSYVHLGQHFYVIPRDNEPTSVGRVEVSSDGRYALAQMGQALVLWKLWDWDLTGKDLAIQANEPRSLNSVPPAVQPAPAKETEEANKPGASAPPVAQSAQVKKEWNASGPGVQDTWYRNGLKLNELHDYEAAIGYFDKVLAIDPQDKRAWYAKGSALYSIGRYSEAGDCYDKARRSAQ